MKVLNFGSLNIDYVYEMDHMVRKGETELAGSRNIFVGGKGLNQSIALGRAGVKVFHAGSVGEDGLFLLDTLKNADVDVSLVRILDDTASGHAIIQNDKDGDNCILLYGGANQAISTEQIDETLSHFEKGDLLGLQNEVNNLSYIIDKAHDIGMQIVLNPSPYNSVIDGINLEYVDYFFVNEIEAASLAGIEENDGEKLAGKLGEKFPAQKIILTLGTEGSFYIYGDEIVKQEVYKVKAVDTTAAGDTFSGYFIAEMIKGRSPKEALNTAAKASAIAVSREGASPSIPTMSEVENYSL